MLIKDPFKELETRDYDQIIVCPFSFPQLVKSLPFVRLFKPANATHPYQSLPVKAIKGSTPPHFQGSAHEKHLPTFTAARL